MKKIIAAIAALSMSAFMLTGCGDTKTGDDALTENITTVAEPAKKSDSTDAPKAEATEKETEAETEAETEKETEAETEKAEDLSDAAATYASLEEFANASDIFDHSGETIAAENSYTYAFVKSLEGGSGFYMNMEAIDGSMSFLMAMGSDSISMIIDGDFDDSGELSNMAVIITDGKMYMLDVSTKSGFSMDLNPEEYAEMFAEYDPEAILSEINIDTDSDLGDITRYKAAIGGKAYYFEFDGNGSDAGMLYDSTGKVCAVIGTDTGTSLSALIINDFTTNIPSNAFDVPAGYDIVDLSAFME